MHHYDFVVFPPFGVLPLMQPGKERPGITRNRNPLFRMRTHASMIGFAHVLMDKRRIIEMPRKEMDLEQRLDWLLKVMASRNTLIG